MSLDNFFGGMARGINRGMNMAYMMDTMETRKRQQAQEDQLAKVNMFVMQDIAAQYQADQGNYKSFVDTVSNTNELIKVADGFRKEDPMLTQKDFGMGKIASASGLSKDHPTVKMLFEAMKKNPDAAINTIMEWSLTEPYSADGMKKVLRDPNTAAEYWMDMSAKANSRKVKLSEMTPEELANATTPMKIKMYQDKKKTLRQRMDKFAKGFNEMMGEETLNTEAMQVLQGRMQSYQKSMEAIDEKIVGLMGEGNKVPTIQKFEGVPYQWDGSKWQRVTVQGRPVGRDPVAEKTGIKQVWGRGEDGKPKLIGSFNESDPRLKQFMGSPDYMISSSVTQGKVDEMGFGTKAQGDIESSMIDNVVVNDRLSNIAKQFDPKYLKWGEQLEQGMLWAKGKMGGELSPEDQEKRKEYASFQRDVIENMNLTIKQITGAQMSEQEADRLMKGMPNMDDDPDGFKAKMDSNIRSIRLALSRDNMLGTKGKDAVTLEGMEDIIRRKAAEYLKKFDGDKRKTREMLVKEFGFMP